MRIRLLGTMVGKTRIKEKEQETDCRGNNSTRRKKHLKKYSKKP